MNRFNHSSRVESAPFLTASLSIGNINSTGKATTRRIIQENWKANAVKDHERSTLKLTFVNESLQPLSRGPKFSFPDCLAFDRQYQFHWKGNYTAHYSGELESKR